MPLKKIVAIMCPLFVFIGCYGTHRACSASQAGRGTAEILV